MTERMQLGKIEFTSQEVLHERDFHSPLLIPTRVRRAGIQLGNLRARNDTAMHLMIYDLSPIPNALSLYTGFERGEAALPLDRVYVAAQRCFYEEEPAMIELRATTEEQRLMRTLTAGTFKEGGITLGRALTLLRLTNLQTKGEFIAKAQIGQVQYTKYERDKVVPQPFIVGQILEAAGVDSAGFPAQIIRLLREKRDPMTLVELHSCTFEELFHYLRQLQGYAGSDVQRQLNKQSSRGLISGIERGRFKPSADMKGRLIQSLALDPKSALAKVVQSKAEHPMTPISAEMVQEVFSGEYDGHYLFAENVQQFYVSDVRAATLLSKLDAKKKQTLKLGQPKLLVGALLHNLRDAKDIGPRELAATTGMSHGDISRIEAGKVLPQDITIMKLLRGLGYDIHHPVTWYLLDAADSVERRYK
jgi:transcriptional regulator with XRE-family HTH domain